MRKVTRKELEAAQREVSIIRQTLDGETNMLCQSHAPRLVMYALLTEAIRMPGPAGRSRQSMSATTSPGKCSLSDCR